MHLGRLHVLIVQILCGLSRLRLVFWCYSHMSRVLRKLFAFRPSQTQIRLYNHRKWLEICNYGFRKRRDCTIYVAKTKLLISCTVTLLFSHMQKAGFLLMRLILLFNIFVQIKSLEQQLTKVSSEKGLESDLKNRFKDDNSILIKR